MSLKLVRVEDAGILDSERVVLRATAEIAVGKYVVLKARKAPTGNVYSGIISTAFWFDTLTVKTGDFVVLYSKAGTRSQKATDSSTSYFFYWQSATPIWTPEFKPVIIYASQWEWPPN